MNAIPAKEPPIVSVVLLTCNRPDYLRESLGSAVRQTLQDIEILVCDNASTEETAAVVAAFHDPRIHYHRHPENVGATQNAWSGFLRARGRYVANLHDDDRWEETFLETLVAVLEAHPEAAIAFSDHWIMDGVGDLLPEATETNTRQYGRNRLAPGLHRPFAWMALCQQSIPMVAAAVMVRADIDLKDAPQLEACYDYWLLYLSCRVGKAAYYQPERLARYRIHAGAESAQGRMRVARGFIQCYERILQDDRMQDIRREIRCGLARARAELGVRLCAAGEKSAGRRELWRAFRLNPRPHEFLVLCWSLFPRILGGYLRGAWQRYFKRVMGRWSSNKH